MECWWKLKKWDLNFIGIFQRSKLTAVLFKPTFTDALIYQRQGLNLRSSLSYSHLAHFDKKEILNRIWLHLPHCFGYHCAWLWLLRIVINAEQVSSKALIYCSSFSSSPPKFSASSWVPYPSFVNVPKVSLLWWWLLPKREKRQDAVAAPDTNYQFPI